MPIQDRKIRVCLVVDSLAGDAGTERQVEAQIRNMDPDRFETHLAVFGPSARSAQLDGLARIVLFPIVSVFSMAGVRQMFAFRRYVKRHDIDIVHAFMLKSALFAVLSHPASRRPVVITSRLSAGYWYTPRMLRLFRLVNRWTGRIFVNSELVRKVTRESEHVPDEQMDTIYQGVDMSRYSRQAGDAEAAGSELGIPSDAPVVGIVANLRPVKDHELFIRAAALVAHRFPKAAFLLVGQGELKASLQSLAAELGIDKQVYFSTPTGRVVDYLARMNIGCLSSHSEGFSNVILEYMAMELPVVAANVGGNSEAIVEGETGFLVSERAPEAFAAPILRLLDDPALAVRMGKAGHARCRERFAIRRTIAELESYYAGLAEMAQRGEKSPATSRSEA